MQSLNYICRSTHLRVQQNTGSLSYKGVTVLFFVAVVQKVGTYNAILHIPVFFLHYSIKTMGGILGNFLKQNLQQQERYDSGTALIHRGLNRNGLQKSIGGQCEWVKLKSFLKSPNQFLKITKQEKPLYFKQRVISSKLTS